MQKSAVLPYYDIVIIGAGVGGLTAAALLSKTGCSVCVLEKEPHVGGYLAGFRRKDFLFDTAIHWLNQCNPDGLLGKVFDILGTDHPVAVQQTRIRRYKGDTFDYLLTNNPDEWRDELIAAFPHEKGGLIRFFKAAKKLGTSFKHFNNIFRSEETMTFFERARNKLRLLEFALPFIPHIRYTGAEGLKKGLNRYFRDENIHRIFAAESEILSCLVPIGWAYYGDFQSPPKGGSQVIPRWLHHIVRYYKNDCFCQSRVTEVLLEDGSCTGVAFEYRGAAYRIRSRYVIAACDVETLYEKMLPEHAVPAAFKKRLRQAELYNSSVTISIALDCPSEQLGFHEELIHLAGERPAEGQSDGEAHAGSSDAHACGDPRTSEISILAPSLRDKSLAPEGQGTLTLYMPAQMQYKDNWHTHRDEQGNYVRGEAYKRLKEEIAGILIGRVEKNLGIDLRSHILFYEVATPVTHYRYTGNKNGTMMGAKPGRENMQSKVAHYRTPVKNLLLGGHWAELGGGVPIAVKAGCNAALIILKKENKAAFRALTRYMDNKITLGELLSNTCFKPYDLSWKAPLTPAERAPASSR
jgi:phytoene dehydrogenase-like protein